MYDLRYDSVFTLTPTRTSICIWLYIHIHTITHLNCFAFEFAGRQESEAIFPFAGVCISYEICPNAFFWTAKSHRVLFCPANSNAKYFLFPFAYGFTFIATFIWLQIYFYLQLTSDLYLLACDLTFPADIYISCNLLTLFLHEQKERRQKTTKTYGHAPGSAASYSFLAAQQPSFSRLVKPALA